MCFSNFVRHHESINDFSNNFISVSRCSTVCIIRPFSFFILSAFLCLTAAFASVSNILITSISHPDLLHSVQYQVLPSSVWVALYHAKYFVCPLQNRCKNTPFYFFRNQDTTPMRTAPWLHRINIPWNRHYSMPFLPFRGQEISIIGD